MLKKPKIRKVTRVRNTGLHKGKKSREGTGEEGKITTLNLLFLIDLTDNILFKTIIERCI